MLKQFVCLLVLCLAVNASPISPESKPSFFSMNIDYQLKFSLYNFLKRKLSSANKRSQTNVLPKHSDVLPDPLNDQSAAFSIRTMRPTTRPRSHVNRVWLLKSPNQRSVMLTRPSARQSKLRAKLKTAPISF